MASVTSLLDKQKKVGNSQVLPTPGVPPTAWAASDGM